MYTKHPTLVEPPENSKIWRFMDFTKFISLLDKQALYFCRADLLGDPFEGTFSKATIDELLKDPRAKALAEQTGITPLVQISKDWMRMNFVNCWHLNDYEPYSMW